MKGLDIYSGFCCDDELNKLTGCKNVAKGSNFCSKTDIKDELMKMSKYLFCPFD